MYLLSSHKADILRVFLERDTKELIYLEYVDTV